MEGGNWVELVERIVTRQNWLEGQVVSTYVPSCKVPTEVLAISVGLWSRHTL